METNTNPVTGFNRQRLGEYFALVASGIFISVYILGIIKNYFLQASPATIMTMVLYLNAGTLGIATIGFYLNKFKLMTMVCLIGLVETLLLIFTR